MPRRVRRRLLISSALTLVACTLLTVAYQFAFFSTSQIRSTDFLFASRTNIRARSTVIVGIDQRSYRTLIPQYGSMANWPRTLYAKVLDRLHQARARVIAFDIFFDAAKPEDPEVATALRRAGNVIMPIEAQGPGRLQPKPGFAQEFDLFFHSTATIEKGAAEKGFVNVTTDPDTVVRRMPMLLLAGDETAAALPLTAVSHFIRRSKVIDAPASESEVYAAGRAIPIAADGTMVINFLGPPSNPQQGVCTIIPFIDVLNGSFDQALVKDRIVLIGLTIRGLDEFSTPTTGRTRMWGVEVLGNAIETVLRQRYLVSVSPDVTVWLIYIMGALAALLVATCRPYLATVGMVSLFGFYLLAAGVLFDGGVLLNLIYPPGAIFLTFGITLVYRVVFEQAEQRMIREVMGRYLSPSVSQWILKEPERLYLGGQTRQMTVLFSDIRGFTTLSHSLDPQALVSILNEYMTAMTQMVFKHDGVLDKYIGDAIMAFWNAPMEQPDHAKRACGTALDMIDKLQELQMGWKQRGMPILELGIGINSGPMVVGNMGSLERLAYTVLGDNVNVASRLEGLSKEYGTHIVIGESTRQAAGPDFEYRVLDLVAVKGRSEPLGVYQLLCRAGQLNPEVAQRLERYQHGIDLYRGRKWEEAAEVFGEILDHTSNDGPSVLYLRRSRECVTNPPPVDWNGVYVAKTK